MHTMKLNWTTCHLLLLTKNSVKGSYRADVVNSLRMWSRSMILLVKNLSPSRWSAQRTPTTTLFLMLLRWTTMASTLVTETIIFPSLLRHHLFLLLLPHQPSICDPPPLRHHQIKTYLLSLLLYRRCKTITTIMLFDSPISFRIVDRYLVVDYLGNIVNHF